MTPDIGAGNLISTADPLLRLGVHAITHFAKRNLKGQGILPVKGSKLVWPGDGTLLAAWRYCEERLLDEGSLEEFDRYRACKRMLKAQRLPPSERAIRLAEHCAGRRPLTQRLARQLLGPFCTLAVLTEVGCYAPYRVARGRATKATLDELMMVLPEGCRERLQAPLAVDVLPPIVAPTMEHAGRALALSGASWRLMAAVGLLRVSAARQSRGMSGLYLNIAERLDQLLPPDEQRNEEAMTVALDAMLDGSPSPAELRCLYQLDGMIGRTREYLRLTLGEDAEEIEALLPAMHRDRAGFRRRAWLLCAAEAEAARALKEKRILTLAPSFEPLMVACDNRMVQAELVFAAATKAMVALKKNGDSDRMVACTGPVVRADGSLAPGEQIIRFELKFERELIDEAMLVHPKEETLIAKRSSRRARPEFGSRIHLVYRGTDPVIDGGESVEPFFVDPIRIGVLDDGVGLTREQEQRRAEVLGQSGFPPAIAPVEGVLHHGSDQRHLLRTLRRVLRSDAPVIVPIANLVYGLGLARIVVGMGARAGARIGETRQLRMECLSSEVRDGSRRWTAKLRPKGWDEEADYEIHKSTMEQIRRCMKMAHGRWFRDEVLGGKSALPVRRFGDWVHPNAPDGRYILVGPSRVLSGAELGVLVRFLFIGIADVLAHDLRYLFATALGLEGVERSRIGVEMHHKSGSYATAKYDLSDLVALHQAGSVESDAAHCLLAMRA